MNKILITEDDQLMATICQDKFRSEGFDVAVARDGNAAIQQLKNSPPDIVLLDLMLPEVNGVEVLKFIRSQKSLRNLPVIVLSNTHVGNLVEAAWRAGANQCLTKSDCTPRRLVEEVRNALAASAAGAGIPEAPDTRPNPTNQTVRVANNGDDSQASLRHEFQVRMPQLLAELRRHLQTLAKIETASGGPCLLELYHTVLSLAGGAVRAGFTLVAQMAGAVEKLLDELRAKPKKVNLSTLRTVAQAVDFLEVLLEHAGHSHNPIIASPIILVLDDDSISREIVCTALEKVDLRAISLGDSGLALKLMEENRFDLIFLDVDMPGLNGYEVCQKIRATSANAKTPVVFVTALTDFETRAQSALSGGTDVIAKPIVLIELAVKAMIHLLRAQLGTAPVL
ncbi:MAG: response regulator [Verrucomicrobiota bacterium]